MAVREGLWNSYLFYGWGGSGKSFVGTSGLVDHKTGVPHATGKWITFGREGNPRIRLPEDYTHMANGKSLSFRAPDLKDRTWLEDFKRFTERLFTNARKGQYIDLVVLDGFAEFDLLYERTFNNMQLGGTDHWAAWSSMLEEFYAAMELLSPDELGCHIIWTTRVANRKKGTYDKKIDEVVGADPEWLNTEYYPAVRGKFHQYMPHYFNMVLYCDTDTEEVTINKEKVLRPVHQVHMLRTGEFFIKNDWGDEWLDAGHPVVLKNPVFYDIQHKLEDFNGAPHILPRIIE